MLYNVIMLSGDFSTHSGQYSLVGSGRRPTRRKWIAGFWNRADAIGFCKRIGGLTYVTKGEYHASRTN